MTEPYEKVGQEAAAFQKMWLDSFAKATQAAFNLAPDSAPPDILRQIRAGIFQTLSQAWDEFMRSPQFLDGMRQWMTNAIAFRKITNEFMGRVRNDFQAPSRSDIDTMMLAVRHMEKRLLDRLDELSARLEKLDGKRVGAALRSRPRTQTRKNSRLVKRKRRTGKASS